MKKKNTLNNIIKKLKYYWFKQGCINIYPLNTEVGAATSHYITSLYILHNKPINVSYLQLCKRPNDSRLNFNNYRLQQYLQLQIIMKPIPYNIQLLYINSLKFIGLNLLNHDLKFIDDNWENPTLGAWGIGWEIWLNGLEITQFTYFHKMCGINCLPTVEITYGIERLGLILQNKSNIYKLIIDYNNLNIPLLYKDIYLLNELEFSLYNLKIRNLKRLYLIYNEFIKESREILFSKKKIILPAYDNILKAINYFNILDANKMFSLAERQRQILKIQKIVKLIANIFLKKKIK